MSERMHHAVVIRQPPGTLVRSAPGSEAPYHFVLWRPLQSSLRLADWQLARRKTGFTAADIEALDWIRTRRRAVIVTASKIDKLSRAERQRAV